MRKLFRHPPRRFIINPYQVDGINQAIFMFANERFLDAAVLFDRQAREMEGSQYLRAAANLYAQAARAYIGAKDEANALTTAQSALTLFIQLHMVRRTALFFFSITNRLEKAGMVNTANQLRSEFSTKVNILPAAETQSTFSGRLPASCPHCGAPPLTDEVDWVDAKRIECSYCGAVIQAG